MPTKNIVPRDSLDGDSNHPNGGEINARTFTNASVKDELPQLPQFDLPSTRNSSHGVDGLAKVPVAESAYERAVTYESSDVSLQLEPEAKEAKQVRRKKS